VPLDIETYLLKKFRGEYVIDDRNYAGHTEVFIDLPQSYAISEIIKKCGEVFAVNNLIKR
jgi:hypothetical protein